MSKPVIKQCDGNGQGSCRRCDLNGKWNRTWMCFLYEIEGLEGCYCEDCVNEYVRDVLREVPDEQAEVH